ncbi:MAG TPA: hypothetical protein VFZ47_04600 [Chitinophagaceae bacterium]
MEPKPSTPMQQALNLHYDTGKDDIWLTNQNSLRILIGILGMLLPVILWIVLVIDVPHIGLMDSISHYYYTRSCSIFVIVVSLLAIFLLIYKGKEPIDFYLSSIAGIFALCVVIFPTSNISKIYPDQDHLYSVTILRESKLRTIFHYLSAAIFLGCLAYMSIFVFTKSTFKNPMNRTKMKRWRNRIYRTCGVIMILAILVIFANFLGWIPDEDFDRLNLTFWMEAVAVESFGFAWLVKAEVFCGDGQGKR